MPRNRSCDGIACQPGGHIEVIASPPRLGSNSKRIGEVGQTPRPIAVVCGSRVDSLLPDRDSHVDVGRITTKLKTGAEGICKVCYSNRVAWLGRVSTFYRALLRADRLV